MTKLFVVVSVKTGKVLSNQALPIKDAQHLAHKLAQKWGQTVRIENADYVAPQQAHSVRLPKPACPDCGTQGKYHSKTCSYITASTLNGVCVYALALTHVEHVPACDVDDSVLALTIMGTLECGCSSEHVCVEHTVSDSPMEKALRVTRDDMPIWQVELLDQQG